ncbi:MAG: hypothetical protein NZ959_03970 [Armatimonadetes bacterium]|nr:hypothetical protein [Armatimonadota bacterium]MDW8122381.1 hypothetical protein [Armatimonadota bacterium]
MDQEESSLREQIYSFLDRAEQGEEAFNRLALNVFAFQWERNSVFRDLCLRLGVSPKDVSDWKQIPPLPTRAFRVLDVSCFPVGNAERVFLSSGTSGGPRQRSRHFVFDLSLYHQSVLRWFVPHLLPENQPIPIAVLFPSPVQLPHSSLAEMFSVIVHHFARNRDSHPWFVGDGRLLVPELMGWLRQAQKEEQPVLLLGTTIGFAHFLSDCDRLNVQFHLPPESRLMDTGGSKGLRRSYPLKEMRSRYERVLGIRADHCINEYGMAELFSQFYDGSVGSPYLAKAVRVDDGLSDRVHRGPPWTRSRVVDPVTLQEVPLGQVGVLSHYDLANWQTAFAVLTEDVAIRAEDGFILIGRADGAEVRGCSLILEDLSSLLYREATGDP